MPKDINTNLRFGFLVHDVSRLRRIVVDRALKPLGITRSQWWVLSFLQRRDGMTQTALAADLDMTKEGVGGLLDRMETGGFIQRRADIADARTRRVYLTKNGTRLLGVIKEGIDQVEAEILARISDDDLAHATRVLSAMKDTLLVLAEADVPEPDRRIDNASE